MVNRIEGDKTVGIKQTLKAVRNNRAKTVYVAKDAEKRLTEPLIKLAEENSLEIIYIDTMKELGSLCGIDVGASAAALLKD